MKKVKEVSISEISTSRMVAGNEKKFTRIFDPKTKKIFHWVGIGWVDTQGKDYDRILKP